MVSYINCSAAVKAQSDLICTSSNAVQLVQQLPEDRPILFAPDQNLGRWVERQSGRELTLWPGSCIVHETFSEQALLRLRQEHPEAEVIAHPECQQHLLDLADFIGSTSKLLQRTETSPAPSFIVLTEPGILHQMRRRAPEQDLLRGARGRWLQLQCLPLHAAEHPREALEVSGDDGSEHRTGRGDPPPGPDPARADAGHERLRSPSAWRR